MSKYKIERWDAVMFNNSLTKVPMIYIKPDITFVDFVNNNNFAVACEISDTETVYDGKVIIGIVDKSCYVPNYRPNFCEKTGLYVITLWANWYGYPEYNKMGVVKFSGMKGNSNDIYKYSDTDVNQSYSPTKLSTAGNKINGLNITQILIATTVLVIFLVAIFIFSRVLRKTNVVN